MKNKADNPVANGSGLAIHWKILIALVLGTGAGYLSTDVSVGGVTLVSVYDFGGQLFLYALKMLIVPLIASSIALGVAGFGYTDLLGSIGFKTGLFCVLTTTTAILTGLVMVNVFGATCCCAIVARLQGEELPRLSRDGTG
jgi:proton glutamate symport protein